MALETAVVFGGSGFIGRHLLASLVARGHTVVSADLRRLEPAISGVHAVTCDVRRAIAADLIPRELRGRTTTVYNLAAIHRTPGHPDREYYDTNVSGALNVTGYCWATGVNRLVFTSSISVYGPDEAPKHESSPPAPESPYGCSKLQAEQIHCNWQLAGAMHHLVTVRPAVIFGPGEGGNFTRLAHALRQRRFFYPGRRDTVKACGHVDELIESFEFALGLEVPFFLYNFCYPDSYTIEDICNAYHRVGGLPRPLGTLPYRSMRAAAVGFERLARIGIETHIHRERIDKLVRSTNIRPSALLDAGYRYRSDLGTAIGSWRDVTEGRFE